MRIPWNRPLQSFTAPQSLGGITVYHDFAWREVFGSGRRRFRQAKAMVREARENAPRGKAPALLLTREPQLHAGPHLLETDEACVLVRQPLEVFARAWAEAPPALHIVPGLSAASALREALGREVRSLFLIDSGQNGPCRVGPEDHDAVRLAFWLEHWRRAGKAREGWPPSHEAAVRGGAALRSALAASARDTRLCLWSSTAWSDQLPLWQTLACLRPEDRGRVDVAFLPEGCGRRYEIVLPSGLAITPPALYRAVWQRRAALSARCHARGAELWRAYAGDDPRRFLALAEQELPPLLHVERAAWLLRFPRVLAGRLRLSPLDSALLGALLEGERPAIGVVHRAARAGVQVLDWLGDYVPSLRLLAWTEGPLPALELVERSELPVHHRYRLTPHGRRLLDQGAGGPEEIPPIDIGGYRADATPPIWAVDEDGERPQLVLAPPSPPLEGTAHFVLGDSAGGSLLMLGLAPQAILRAWDPCTDGPCRADPRAHLRVRARAWPAETSPWAGRVFGRRVAEAAGGRLCLWIGTDWGEQLFLWRMCDKLVREAVAPARIEVVFLDEALENGCPRTIGMCDPHRLQKLWRQRMPTSAKLLARGAALWHAFVADTPAPFAALCAEEHPDPLRPRLTELASLLPRRTARGLALSRLDHTLLAPFRDGPGRWLRGLEDCARGWDALLQAFGDRMLQDRVVGWSRAAPPALECSRPSARSGADVYRLTPHGERLLAEGFRDPSEHLPLPFGGYANDGRTPVWVCVEGNGTVQVAPL